MVTAAPAPAADSRSLSREIASAYVYAVARIGSWALLSAWVYRTAGPFDFGLLAVVRGTIGILNYTSLGLAPAMIRLLAESTRAGNSVAASSALPVLPLDNATLAYRGAPSAAPRERVVFTNGLIVAALAACIGLVVTLIYAENFDRIFRVPDRLIGEGARLIFLIGLGTVIRLFSDAAGAMLQTRGRIALDNWLLSGSEFLWVLFAWWLADDNGLYAVGMAYLLASAGLLGMRYFEVNRLDGKPGHLVLRWLDGGIIRRIFSLGILIWFAQLADYLYSPTDYLLIGHFLGPFAASVYAPAVQIDAGLLVLVTGLASVLLPRTALADAAEDVDAIRRYYVRGTLASLALLTTAALCIALLSPWIFRLWLGNAMDPSRAILPLVLIHTVIGGSSAVGRSVLLGMGRVKPFTIAVLVAGITNVVVSWALVRYTNLGLTGIVLGTIVAVTGRCALWMPWYVQRTLKSQHKMKMVHHHKDTESAENTKGIQV